MLIIRPIKFTIKKQLIQTQLQIDDRIKQTIIITRWPRKQLEIHLKKLANLELNHLANQKPQEPKLQRLRLQKPQEPQKPRLPQLPNHQRLMPLLQLPPPHQQKDQHHQSQQKQKFKDLLQLKNQDQSQKPKSQKRHKRDQASQEKLAEKQNPKKINKLPKNDRLCGVFFYSIPYFLIITFQTEMFIYQYLIHHNVTA